MKRYASLIFSVLLSLVGTTVAFSQKTSLIKNSSLIEESNGLSLRIDLEYTVNKKKVLAKDKYVEYTITNVGKVVYDGTQKDHKNAIVFDLTTSDEKVIEKPVSFFEVLSPGKSTVIKYFSADVGSKLTCVAVKPSRLDFWTSN